MKIKVFNIEDYEEVNKFIDNVELLEEGAVQITSDSNIVVFYKDEENHDKKYIEHLIKRMERELFYEDMKIISTEKELAMAEKLAEGLSDKSPEAKTVKKKQESLNASHEYIALTKTKIDAYRKKLN